MSSGPATLQPTFTGHVATTNDALILFEACLSGQLSHVPRRPHDRERKSLIRSGCIFIYEENASGIKRWTDGVTWSPSRILGNFLVYRELDKPFPPGEKKRAMKKTSRQRLGRPGEPYVRSECHSGTFSPTTPSTVSFASDRVPNEMERSLIGSLVDSYGFKADGLVKKTMSVTVQGVTHHLVSYYGVNDVLNSQLRTPSQTESLNYVRPRMELTSKQSFRSPLEETEDLEGFREHYMAVQPSYGYRTHLVAQPGYLPPSGPYYGHVYPPVSGHPISTTGYHAGTPALSRNYMPTTMSNGQAGHRADDYGHYPPPTFSRPYEPMSSTSLASHPTMSSSAAPPVSSGLQVHHQPHPLSLYSHASSVPVRKSSTSGSISMEPRAPTSYPRSTYGFSNHSGQPPADADGHHSMHASPVMKQEVRDGQHATNAVIGRRSSPIYGHDSPQLYGNSGGGPLGHGSYHSGANLPSWPAPTAAHHHM
jgi:Gti1/Pac2 family transcription factor